MLQLVLLFMIKIEEPLGIFDCWSGRKKTWHVCALNSFLDQTIDSEMNQQRDWFQEGKLCFGFVYPVFPFKSLKRFFFMYYYYYFLAIRYMCIPEAITYSAVCQTHDIFILCFKKDKEICKFILKNFCNNLMFYLTNQER